jgi:hypothetical protein
MSVNNVPLCLGHAVAARGRLLRRGLRMSSFRGDVLALLREPLMPDRRRPDGAKREPAGAPAAADPSPEIPPAAASAPAGDAPLAGPAEAPQAALPPLEVDIEAALTILAENPAFAKVTYDDLLALGRQGRKRRVLEGRVLVWQGDRCERVYLLVNGTARMERPRKHRAPVVSNFGPGEVVGAVGLLHGGRYTATVTALEDQQVLELTREDVGGLFREHPSLRPAFQRILHSRLALQ